MPATYHFDHLHIVSREPNVTAQYFQKMFDAKVIETVQSDGKPRIDVDLNGLPIFIYLVTPEDRTPVCPSGRYLGLDHFGLRVDNLDEAVVELRKRGVEFVQEPRTARPGLKMAFIRGPEDIRIELMERA